MNIRLYSMARLSITILILFLSAFSSLGCFSSRDSGSTVTGRASQYPFGNLPFMRVLISGENGKRFQITDSTGTFSMYHVPKGSYEVKFAFLGLDIYSQDLVIDDDELTVVVDPPKFTAGAATLDISVVDPEAEAGIAKAHVWFIYKNGTIAHGYTGSDGTYKMVNLTDGDATVIAVADGYLNKTVGEVKLGFEGITELEIEMTPKPEVKTGSLIGVIMDEDGKRIDDAYIGILKGSDVPSIYAIPEFETLAEKGEAIFEEIPVGSHIVYVTKSGYVPQVETLVVEENGEYTLEFVLTSEETAWKQFKLGQGAEIK